MCNYPGCTMNSVLGEGYCIRHMKVLKWLDDGFTDSEEMGQRFIEPQPNEEHKHSPIHTSDLVDGQYEETCSCEATRKMDANLQASTEWTNPEVRGDVVFCRKSCMFNYCPNPGLCKDKCIHSGNMPKEVKEGPLPTEHPDCSDFVDLDNKGYANVCKGYEPWSCNRTQKEGKCRKITKIAPTVKEEKDGPDGKKSSE